MKTGHRLVMIACVAALSGCAVAPVTSAKQLQQLKDQNLARVVAQTSAFSTFSIGAEYDLGIKEVDGASVQVNKHGELQDRIDVTLAPGKHALGIDCMLDPTQETNGGPRTETTVEVDLVGGHVYEISAKGFSAETGACSGIVTDVTDTIGQPGHS